MSRAYRMSVEICGYNPERTSEIQEAANAEWSWDDWDFWYSSKEKNMPVMAALGENQLCGGEAEDEFARRVMRAIWRTKRAVKLR